MIGIPSLAYICVAEPLSKFSAQVEQFNFVLPTHPAAKAVAELGLSEAGYDLWRSRPLMTSEMVGRKPEDRYKEDTYKLSKWAGKVTGTAPIKWDRGLSTATAGGVTQLFPKKGPEGRPSIFYKVPARFLTKTFMSSGYSETPEEVEMRKRAQELKLEGGSEAFKFREEAASFVAPFIQLQFFLTN